MLQCLLCLLALSHVLEGADEQGPTGNTLDDVHQAALRTLVEGMIALKLLTGTTVESADAYSAEATSVHFAVTPPTTFVP